MQTVLITGVTSGIGHALATHYAANGARVLGIGRRALPQSLVSRVQPADYYRARKHRRKALMPGFGNQASPARPALGNRRRRWKSET